MRTQLVTVTPQLAEEYLKYNDKNRKPNPSTVLAYAALMAQGKWKPKTGESIKIARNGRLLDGQQRLMAIVKSGVCIEFLVTSELDEDVFDVLDTGRKRSSGDVFHIVDIKNATNTAAAIRRYFLFKKGWINRNASPGGTETLRLLEEYNERPEFWQYAINTAQQNYIAFSRIIAQSEIAALYALFFDIDATLAEPFLTQLCTGENIKNHTITVLRKMLISDKLNLRSVPTAKRIAWIFKAWNYVHRGIRVKKIYYTPESEDYPIPF